MVSAILGATFAALPPLRVEGSRLIGPSGRTVILRGCNLGNWFVTENWMLDQDQPEGSSKDQFTLEALLDRRFGKSERERLMELHRSSWITERDFPIIKSFRFNCVRLPLNYRQFEDDSSPYRLRTDAWRWTDKAIAWAKKHGLYVILDMHGVQGGQSPYDHTGRSDQNKLWTDRENSKRLAWLWGEVAKRYRKDPTVVAYDVFNEPYGGELPQIRRVFDEVLPYIRANDPDKLVWAMGRYDSFDCYGIPKANGWRNVGIQMHYYPGIFGNGAPTRNNHLRHLDWLKREVAPKVAKLQVPFLVGEMNVLFESAGGAEMMRRTYDLHESLGWNTTMWSYKALSQPGGLASANWGMVTNKHPFKPINFATAPKEEIEAFFASHASMPYTINEPLRKYLAPIKVALKKLPPILHRSAAPQESLAGWTATDLGGCRKGGLKLLPDGFALFGGGEDIWGHTDQCRFLNQQVEADFDLVVRVTGLEDVGSYCKAGVMIRAKLDADSPHVMMTTFPNGELQLATRSQAKGDTASITTKDAGLPVWIRLVRRGDSVTAFMRKNPTESWLTVGTASVAGFPSRVYAGVLALSHNNSELVKASYTNLSIDRIKEK